MTSTLRYVSWGMAGLSAASIVGLLAAGVAALFGNRTISERFFVTVFGVWLALVLAMGFLYGLHAILGD